MLLGAFNTRARRAFRSRRAASGAELSPAPPQSPAASRAPREPARGYAGRLRVTRRAFAAKCDQPAPTGYSSVCPVSSSTGRSKIVPAAVQTNTAAKHKATIRRWRSQSFPRGIILKPLCLGRTPPLRHPPQRVLAAPRDCLPSGGFCLRARHSLHIVG
jgi:hypothetical protein